jgi:PAS domain S-box-containing protein
MSKKTSEINQQLRESAEAQVNHAKLIALPFTSTAKILHELRVHKIELEMQNEELRRAQLALEESRDRYVDLYELAPISYLTLTLDGTIAEINLTAIILFGVERVKLISHRFAHYIIPEDRDRWHHHFLTIKQQGGKHACELNLIRTDGSSLCAQIDCLYIESESEESQPALRLTITDITTRKQIEDALRASEARLAAILEGSELSAWDWNIQTGDCTFDGRWSDICGYPLEEIEPHIEFWKQNVFANDLPCVQKALTAHLKGYTPFFTAE